MLYFVAKETVSGWMPIPGNNFDSPGPAWRVADKMNAQKAGRYAVVRPGHVEVPRED